MSALTRQGWSVSVVQHMFLDSCVITCFVTRNPRKFKGMCIFAQNVVDLPFQKMWLCIKIMQYQRDLSFFLIVLARTFLILSCVLKYLYVFIDNYG